jgi:hypothetical protein
MAIQMYIVQVKNGESESDRVAVAECIAGIQGFVLMATSAGSLIAAFDDRFADTVRSHPTVEFVGGVSFNPDGPLVERFQRLFAENVASQLTERGAQAPETDVQAPGGSAKQPGFPPGYRPIRWPKRE